MAAPAGRLQGEQRKSLVKRIKELQPVASNRVIAKVVGSDERTVRRDTAANAAPDGKNVNNINGGHGTSAANAAPTITGQEAAKAAGRA